MKKLFSRLTALSLILLLMGGLSLPIFAEERSYSILLDPDLSETDGVFSTYMIDFCAPAAPDYTRWTLATFDLYPSIETTTRYPDLEGKTWNTQFSHSNGWGVYMNGDSASYSVNGSSAYLSPKILYPQSVSLQASFSGIYRKTFPLRANNWYTLVLHTWEDPARGTTLLGEWIVDQESGLWTLFTCIDTRYINSGLTGSMSACMEQSSFFNPYYREKDRSFNIKGLYARNKSDGKWNLINSATLKSTNTDESQPLVGSYEFGAEESYFWGKTNGKKLPNQEGYEQTAQQQERFTIHAPSQPTLATLTAENLTLTAKSEDTWTVSWSVPASSTPQLSYQVKILDSRARIVCEKSAALPFEYGTDITLPNLQDAYTCVLTLTDLFGNTLTLKEENFTGYEPPSPSPDGESPASEEEEPFPESNFSGISKELPVSAPETPVFSTPNTPSTPNPPQAPPPPGRKIGVGVAVLFFAAGILAALGTAVGMIRQERGSSRSDDG